MQLIYPTIPTYKGSPVFRYFININNHVGFMIKSRKQNISGTTVRVLVWTHRVFDSRSNFAVDDQTFRSLRQASIWIMIAISMK